MTKSPIVETQRGAIQAWTCSIDGWTTLADAATAEKHVRKAHAPDPEPEESKKPIDKAGGPRIP